jgi:hypothetical protein
VHQPLDALLQLHERAVADEVDHAAPHAAVDRELLLDLLPGRGFLLLQAQGDLLLLQIDPQDLHLQLLADPDQIAGMVDPPPGHVGDVQQAVEPAQVDEGAEVGDVGDRARDQIALLDGLQQSLLRRLPLLLDELAAADDDVATALVDLEDARPDRLPDVLADIAGPADVHLRGGQEDGHADVHEQAALDLPHASPLDDVALVIGLQDPLPAADPVGLALGQLDDARLVLQRVQHHLDDVADLQVLVVVELALVDQALRLEAHVHDDVVAGPTHDPPLEDVADLELLQVLLEQAVHVTLGHLLAEGLPDQVVRLVDVDPDARDQVVVNHASLRVRLIMPHRAVRAGRARTATAGPPGDRPGWKRLIGPERPARCGANR